MTGFRGSAAYRIAFACSAAFALAILLLGAAVYLAADHEFRRQRDHAIVEEATRVAVLATLPAIAAEVDRPSRENGHDAFRYGLVDERGRRLAGSLDAGAAAPGWSDLTFEDAREGRDSARSLTVALARGGRLSVGVDAEWIERIDTVILALFGVGFAAVVALGAVGALLLGGYLRRRLVTVTATAGAIVAGDLARRVPVGTRGDEFDEVGRAVNAMLDRIAMLMDSLRQVSSDVAHDLRTPLVRLRAELARAGRDEGAAARAMEQADALLSLFAAILRIAEVEGGSALAKSPVDLGALTAELAETYEPALADSGHPLSWMVSPPGMVEGDRELLAQALVNLLDNARIHTPPGTRVRLELVADEARVRLTVSDDGPGVPAVDRRRILERFARGEASRTTPGHGLGLSLVRAIAAAHGGDVDIGDAAPGLRVTIGLPRAV